MSGKYTPRSDDPWAKEREKKESVWFSRASLSNHMDSVIMLSLISSIFYIFITSYYISYFHRLSIQFYTLDLPLTFYLYAAKQLLIFIFFLFSIYYVINTISILNKGLIFKNYMRTLGLIFCYSFLIFNYIYLLGLFKTENILYSLFPAIFYLIYVKAYENKVADRTGFIFLNIFLIYLIIFVYIPILGTNSAENLIEGTDGSLEIELDLNYNNYSLPNGTLILVTHSNNKYFLIEQNKSHLENENLYIIPDDQIKMVTVKPVKKEQKNSYDLKQKYYNFIEWIKNN